MFSFTSEQNTSIGVHCESHEHKVKYAIASRNENKSYNPGNGIIDIDSAMELFKDMSSVVTLSQSRLGYALAKTFPTLSD